MEQAKIPKCVSVAIVRAFERFVTALRELNRSRKAIARERHVIACSDIKCMARDEETTSAAIKERLYRTTHAHLESGSNPITGRLYIS